MKFLYFLLFFIQSGSYTVIAVEGRAFVDRKNTSVELHQGSTVYAEEKVRFEKNKGAIRLAGTGGTMRLSNDADPRNEKPGGPGIWVNIAKSALPTVVVREMKGRAGIISNQLEAESFFKQFQTAEQPMLVLDKLSIAVSNKYITDTANQFFYIAYLNKGELINKRISFSATASSLNMIFDEKLFFIDGIKSGQTRLSAAKIYYYDSKAAKSILISDFNLRWESFATIKTELCLISAAMKVNANSADRSQMLNYLRAYYGSIDEDLFLAQYYPNLNCKN